MKKNKVILVNSICYLLIFIFILLVFMPLILRFFVPKSNPKELKIQMLWCKKSALRENKNIKINYKNGKVTTININYENVDGDTIVEEKDLINKLGVSYKSTDKNIIITVENNAITRQAFKDLFDNITKVKATYENKDYSCKIIAIK